MSAECGTHGTDLSYPEGSWPVGICVQCELENDLTWVRKDRDSWKKMAEITRERAERAETTLQSVKAVATSLAYAAPEGMYLHLNDLFEILGMNEK